MAKKKYNEVDMPTGDLSDLKGLPKDVNLGEHKKRLSAHMQAGKAQIEGDQALGKLCIAALKKTGTFSRATQGFHSYPARLHPEAAKLLLEALPGESLGDPFCGGGTLIVEALIQGRRCFASDLNPVATLVCAARTALLSEAQFKELEDDFDELTMAAEESLKLGQKLHLHRSILKYKSWYKPNCFEELAALYAAIETRQAALKVLHQAVFSSLVVKYSLRASDTSNRVVHIARKNGTVIKAFKAKGREYLEQLRELRDLVPKGTAAVDIQLADAKMLPFSGLDTIITSPPYPGTYDYLLLQQLRQAWFDLDMAEDSEIGSRKAFKQPKKGYEQWLKDSDAWMKAAAKALNPSGQLAVIVGEGMSAGRSLRVAKPTILAAEKAGLSLKCSASVQRHDPATQTKKLEYVLVFEKKIAPKELG